MSLFSQVHACILPSPCSVLSLTLCHSRIVSLSQSLCQTVAVGGLSVGEENWLCKLPKTHTSIIYAYQILGSSLWWLRTYTHIHSVRTHASNMCTLVRAQTQNYTFNVCKEALAPAALAFTAAGVHGCVCIHVCTSVCVALCSIKFKWYCLGNVWMCKYHFSFSIMLLMFYQSACLTHHFLSLSQVLLCRFPQSPS